MFVWVVLFLFFLFGWFCDWGFWGVWVFSVVCFWCVGVLVFFLAVCFLECSLSGVAFVLVVVVRVVGVLLGRVFWFARVVLGAVCFWFFSLVVCVVSGFFWFLFGCWCFFVFVCDFFW